MRDEARLRDLRLQRVALEARLKEAREKASSSIMAPQMERALAALNDLIAREEADDA